MVLQSKKQRRAQLTTSEVFDIVTRQWDTAHPAASAVDPGGAHTLVDLLELRGAELHARLRMLDIVPASRGRAVDIDRYHEHVGRYEVVIMGDRAEHPSAPEPRHSTLLCTCS